MLTIAGALALQRAFVEAVGDGLAGAYLVNLPGICVAEFLTMPWGGLHGDAVSPRLWSALAQAGALGFWTAVFAMAIAFAWFWMQHRWQRGWHRGISSLRRTSPASSAIRASVRGR